jgi:hypothetical protein
MIPHEKTMVEKLKNRPFALLGINSDQDRDVLKDKKDSKRMAEITALAAEARAQLPAEDQALIAKVHGANIAYLNRILKEQGISWRQAAQESTRGPIPTRWNVQGWPTIYVLDAAGKIRFKDLRDQELEDAVVRLLDELEKPAQK